MSARTKFLIRTMLKMVKEMEMKHAYRFIMYGNDEFMTHAMKVMMFKYWCLIKGVI